MILRGLNSNSQTNAMSSSRIQFKVIRQMRVTAVLSGMLICFFAGAQVSSTHIDVMDFGAIADSHHVSTQAIQSSIDHCFEQGGGTVYFPPGNYKSGTIVLKENVWLHFDSGATLYASRDINDYRMPLQDATRPILVYANGAKNIGISGKGTIHGNAKRIYADLKKVDTFIANITENARNAGVEMKQYYAVPPDVGMILFFNCVNVQFKDISMVESSFWTLHLIKCNQVSIKSIRINSSLEKGVNSDGIDINSSQDVEISNCNISTGDDAIALKTRYFEPCENIVVSNCVLSSSSTALKLGTESRGDFRNIIFRNCVIQNSNRGLSIVVREGALVENVLFSNITIECQRRHFNWWGNADPIWVCVTKKVPESKVGYIKNVTFENIVAIGMGTSKIESTEGMRIENIQLINVQLSMNQESLPDKRASHAFEFNHVVGLKLSNLVVKWDAKHNEENWKSAIYASQVKNLNIHNFVGSQGLTDSKNPVIELHSVQNSSLINCEPTHRALEMVRITGEDSENISLERIDSAAKTQSKVSIDDDVRNKSSIKLIN